MWVCWAELACENRGIRAAATRPTLVVRGAGMTATETESRGNGSHRGDAGRA